MLVAAVAGTVGGMISGTVAGMVDGLADGALYESVWQEALLWGVSLPVGAAAAYGRSHWAGRGLAGGAAYGLSSGGLSIVLGSIPIGWGTMLLAEAFGGVVGGLLLAYLWRPASEKAAST
jgi:hypothetical protein